MKINTMNIAIILLLAMALTSCGEHSWDELFGDSSSSVATDDGPSSSSRPSSSSKKATSSSSGGIVIEDENISPAASFASEVFTYIAFPFLGLNNWLSISKKLWWEKFDELDWYVNRNDNEGGDAFLSIFKLLYDNKEEYLNNGKFKRYIELLANLIPYDTYVSNGWDTMVRQLLVAYDNLKDIPGSFSEIYDIMDANDEYNNATETYPQILDFINDDEQLEDFILEQDVEDTGYYAWDATEGNVNRSAVVWAYSFWGRRYNENPQSIEPIVNILRMLRDKYPNK